MKIRKDGPKKSKKTEKRMGTERKNQINRIVLEGLVFDVGNAGSKFMTRMYIVAIRAGVSDEEFNQWHRKLLKDHNDKITPQR